MVENNKAFIGFVFGVFCTTIIAFILWISPTDYEVKTPVNPKIQITYTEGISDTVYIYRFN